MSAVCEFCERQPTDEELMALTNLLHHTIITDTDNRPFEVLAVTVCEGVTSIQLVRVS